ncbi:MAG: tyrosine-type recombinase/integrase [Bryobacteraceae bacterium]
MMALPKGLTHLHKNHLRKIRALPTSHEAALPKSKCLFVWEDGKPIKDFRASWEKACELAGVPGLLFHDLRRTAVHNLIRAGVSEKVAMAISGHKTASMLWQYNITDTRDIQEAERRMQLYLEQQQSAEPTEPQDVKPS